MACYQVRKVGDWSLNRSGPHGSAGYYVEAIEVPRDQPRYALADPDYLEEAVSHALVRGEVVALDLDPYAFVTRLDDLELRGWR